MTLDRLILMQMSRKLAGTPKIGVARRLGLIGLGLYLLGFVLGGVGNLSTTSANFYWITPFADTITALGFVLAILGAIRAGSSTREILIVGIIFGIGTFYVGEPHFTHTESGIGFGLEHLTHIFIGLGLFGVATAIATLLSFYHTRTSKS